MNVDIAQSFKRIKRLVPALIIAVFAAACLIPYQTAVVFEKEDSGEIIAFLPLQKKKSFDAMISAGTSRFMIFNFPIFSISPAE